MNEFVASNGVRIEIDGMGYLVGRSYGEKNHVGLVECTAGPDAGVQALREFFLTERDAELGRWRSREQPNTIVYRDPDSADGVLAIDESGPEWVEVTRQNFEGRGTEQPVGVFAAAREFFAAHPEPKPWHDAKPGEVWALTVSGRESAWSLCEDVAEWHQAGTGSVLKSAPSSPAITAGRRIWPEVSA